MKDEQMKYVIFKSNDLKTILKHSMENKGYYPYTKETTKEQGLRLVKDEGVYLMPSTNVPLKDPIREDRLLVVYAIGYGPTEWEKCREFSGDDFVEFIPIKPEGIKLILEHDYPSIKIGLSKTQISIIVEAKEETK